jgi:hypothetical protein
VLQEYELLLDMNDFAAKEHGIAPEYVYFLQPQHGGARQVHLR